MSLYFITSNKNKFDEFQHHIPDIEQLDIDLVEIQSMDQEQIVRYKLIEASKHRDGALIVEDTGLFLDCLGGFPGPLVKFMEKSAGHTKIVEMCEKLGNTKARAVVMIGYKNADVIKTFSGEVTGTIVKPRRSNGFSWDVMFMPDGYDKTFAEMTFEQKNKLNARFLAISQLNAYLRKKS